MIQSWLDAEKRGKFILIAATLIMWLLIVFSFKFYGYEETWKLWKVPVASIPFLDFRLIPGSAESFREGFEPTIKNPGDPAGRIFNYPAFWRLFFYTGITEENSLWVVVPLMWGLFFLGIVLFPQKLTILSSLGMLMIIFSPASMLLYERGNVDLIVFFLCALVVLSADYSTILTFAILTFAAIVKIFPLFGVTIFLKESKSRFIWFFLSGLGIVGTYLFITSGSVKASWDLTMRGKEISYGANVLFLQYSPYFSNLLGILPTSPLLKYGPIVLAIVLILISGFIGMRTHEPLTSSSTRNLTAFRMGASIYVGTFLLGNNWDYRLAFLIFVIPQLFDWAQAGNSTQCRIIAISVLVLVFTSCWHFVFWYAPSLEAVKEILFIIDEFSNWALIVGFSYLLVASLPDWVKALFSIRSSNLEVVQTA